ncbi:uncharacterized protein FA14DRAFT_187922 [Meira miltonrushii]|uniref:SH3 domain-containing protein n=1 Tax=Meira miltonrushii TaxID=1280837 RepID=A0A316VJV4_9BASI|nr:uncharacterized protein FA14DRAFT_187922 [Meira miltonrushii]PWN37872.1 hypothetical protein FA14DRAFT_187922 [Meira miltonrushii]
MSTSSLSRIPASQQHQQRRSWITLGALLLLCSCFIATVKADDFPSIDFQGLGNVGVAGAFDGIAIWKPDLATNNQSNVYNSNVSSLVFRDNTGALSKINETNQGGRIRAICQRSTAPRTVYVGGLFTQIGGLNASNIAAYDPTAKAWDNLNGGLNGEVLSLYCDDLHSIIYAGGSFVKPANVSNVTDTSRYLGAVATYNYTSKLWAPAPFGGVNGSVTQIDQGVNASTIRFAGAFSTNFSSTVGKNISISGTNSSASPLSIAYAPLPLGQTEFQGGPSSANASFANPAQILCPQGNDGANNSYLFADNTTGRLTMRAFRNLPTRAFRLGNTFVEGRGTKTFGIISIPDNTQLELQYLDTETQKNATCTTDCPLTNDAAIPYQDFLITNNPANGLQNGIKQLTGIQFTATAWYGNGAGLHLMQLLTDGSAAFAYPAYNRGACQSKAVGARGFTSTTNNTGAWYYSNVRLSSTNTLEPVATLSDDFSNLSNNLDAQVSWTLDVQYDGNYTAYMFVPGCQDGDQCNVRTHVQARLINNATTLAKPGNWTRVPQTNPNDTTIQIFSGPVQKSSNGFKPVVQMTIPKDAPKPSGSDRFSVYADRVSLQLFNSNETYQYYQASATGVFEYNVFDNNANNNSLAYAADPILANTTSLKGNATLLQEALVGLYNGTGMLPNSSMTALDYFGVTLDNEGVRKNESDVVYTIQSVASRTFVGGQFASTNVTNTTGFANLVSYEDAGQGKNYTRLTGGGLNGPVYATAQVGGFLFVGGDFSATADNTTAISYVARYDPKANVWASLGTGVDGVVRSIVTMNDQLLVIGGFDSVNGTHQTGGIGVYDTTSKTWVAQPLPVVGAMSAVSSSDAGTYVAGEIESVGSTPADAAVQLQAPQVAGNYPNITTYNFQFTNTNTKPRPVPSGAKAAPNARRRSLGELTMGKRDDEHEEGKRDSSFIAKLASRASNALQSRSSIESDLQLSSLFKRADVMDPPSLDTEGDNEILSTAFWQRNSTNYMSVLGGNFTTSSGVKNLGIYDTQSRVLSSFPPFPEGSNLTVVRAVYVDKDTLYAGGDGGILSFDLRKATWNNLPPLSTKAGTVLSVRAIGHRPGSTTMIVAGTFTNAGGLPCANVCQWDSKMLRWISIGNGVDGNIAALDFAGNKANTLVLAGSINMAGREVALASWVFDNNQNDQWTALGTVGGGPGQAPGPATAVSVDNLNANSIFVAGRSNSGTSPYLTKWDGMVFNALGSNELQSTTGIAQLSFVGLTKPHPENTVLESNRMLVVSGALNMQTYGNVSTALFDGQSWTPFLLSTRTGGGPGVVRAFTRSVEVLNFMNLHRLPVGIVILISIALGLGVVFLLVLLGLIWALLFRRRRNKNAGVVVPVHGSDDTLAAGAAGASNAEGKKRRPSSLLATLNKATENVMGDYQSEQMHDVGGKDIDGPSTSAAAAIGGGAAVGAGAAGLAGVGASSTSHGHSSGEAATSHGHGSGNATSHGHGRERESAAYLASTQGHSDETGNAANSSQYHSDGLTGRSGVSRYYSGEEDNGVPAAAGGTAAAAAIASSSTQPPKQQEELDGIEAHARYTFEATHQSELGVHAGEKIWILDDQDEHWWLARNAEGKTGVLPASYVL